MPRRLTRPGKQTKRSLHSGGPTTRTKTRQVSAPGKPFTNWKTTKATVTLGTTNSALSFVSKVGHLTGSHSGSVRVRIVVSGNNTPLSISVSGNNDITINAATGAGGAATTTAAQAVAAVNQDASARNIVDAFLPATSNGTGVVASAAFTSLA